MIPFNKPFLTGKEVAYIEQAVASGKISGNGDFTKLCQAFFERRYNIKKALLTSSCTDALEMCALLCNIGYGDEIIIPSFTFVSSALAFVREGAKVIFADSYLNNPNIDVAQIEPLITSRTKAIVVVHYAGIACDMEAVMSIANRHNLIVIEDAAQGIESFYKGRALGSIGHLSAFSFHETKNIISGEGGLLGINDERFIRRAEILWEKGTNRAEFFRGEVNKYGWVDTGSSFLSSEITAAFLWAQLENIDCIQKKRKQIWDEYYNLLGGLENRIDLPMIPGYASNNAHMFFLSCKNLAERTSLISYLKENGVMAVFHYLSLHRSEFYSKKHDGRPLLNSDKFTDNLVRLPLFYEMTLEQVREVCLLIRQFYEF